MAINLYWMQCGGCGGDSMSMLNAESPGLIEAKNIYDLNILWHPVLSACTLSEHREVFAAILNGDLRLDILCVEGAIIRGPGNTGLFDTFEDQPKMELVRRLAQRAGVVVAIGTCACFGGVTAAGETDAVGLQFAKKTSGGLLGEAFRSGKGLPVINLPGCPVHPRTLIGAIVSIAAGNTPALNAFNSPLEYYGMFIHQGCTRNEYYEYRIEEAELGKKGCLFFHLGCQGPLSHGSCNKFLWNNRNSKTRSGVPCFGCTEPDFPKDFPFFYTPNIAHMPINLPDGVNRPHYLAYKSMAAAAAPERLKRRETEV